MPALSLPFPSFYAATNYTVGQAMPGRMISLNTIALPEAIYCSGVN